METTSKNMHIIINNHHPQLSKYYILKQKTSFSHRAEMTEIIYLTIVRLLFYHIALQLFESYQSLWDFTCFHVAPLRLTVLKKKKKNTSVMALFTFISSRAWPVLRGGGLPRLLTSLSPIFSVRHKLFSMNQTKHFFFFHSEKSSNNNLS